MCEPTLCDQFYPLRHHPSAGTVPQSLLHVIAKRQAGKGRLVDLLHDTYPGSPLAPAANDVTDQIRPALLPRPQGVWLRQTPLAALGVAPRFARRYAQRKAGIEDDNDGRETLDQLS